MDKELEKRIEYKDYKVSKHNSTVLGYPGRDFDWSKFDWHGESIHIDRCECPNCDKEHTRRKAPLPFKDDCLIGENCEYLHIPYDWEEMSTIYRVRPNDCMWAGEVYRGKLIKSQKAVLKDGIWYWRLIF